MKVQFNPLMCKFVVVLNQYILIYLSLHTDVIFLLNKGMNGLNLIISR